MCAAVLVAVAELETAAGIRTARRLDTAPKPIVEPMADHLAAGPRAAGQPDTGPTTRPTETPAPPVRQAAGHPAVAHMAVADCPAVGTAVADEMAAAGQPDIGRTARPTETLVAQQVADRPAGDMAVADCPAAQVADRPASIAAAEHLAAGTAVAGQLADRAGTAPRARPTETPAVQQAAEHLAVDTTAVADHPAARREQLAATVVFRR